MSIFALNVLFIIIAAENSVMEALHVIPGTVGMTYTKTAGDLMPLYSDLMQKYQILIYSGDTDGKCCAIISEYRSTPIIFITQAVCRTLEVRDGLAV